MPRILSPDPARSPGPVISLPRPRQVQATDQVGRALQGLGSTVSAVGQEALSRSIDAELRAEALNIRTRAEQRFGELRNEVDQAGTAADARRAWEQGLPKVKAELERFAQERGLPEISDELGFTATQHANEVAAGLGKRAAREEVDAAQNFAAAQEDAIANAGSEIEAQRHSIALDRALEGLAQNNPMVSPGAAGQLSREARSNGATRRAQGGIAQRADDPDALRAYAAAIREGQLADLPADDRAVFAQRADDAADRAELHNLAMIDRAEARQERIARRQREANETQWAVDVARGEASIEDLTAALERRDIDVSFFDRTVRAMQSDAAEAGDPEMSLILRAGAYDGTVTAVDVMTADIPQRDKEQLLNIIGTRGTETVLHRPETKRARDFLVDSIAGPRGPLGQFLDPNDAQRVASAEREFDERVLAGEDRWSVTEQMIPQFRVTPVTAAEIGRPMFLVGTLTNPDVPATAQALIDAYFAGEITEAEMVRERDRLIRLAEAARDAKTRRDAAAAATAERRR
jgi:hypothetical protein